jgi:hypothetical protein
VVSQRTRTTGLDGPKSELHLIKMYIVHCCHLETKMCAVELHSVKHLEERIVSACSGTTNRNWCREFAKMCCAFAWMTDITNSMELSTARGAISCAATQELPSICGTLRFITMLVPIQSQISPAHTTPSNLYKIQLNAYYPPTTGLVFLVVSFLLAFPPISYIHSSSPPFVLHALPISFSLIDHSS